MENVLYAVDEGIATLTLAALDDLPLANILRGGMQFLSKKQPGGE